MASVPNMSTARGIAPPSLPQRHLVTQVCQPQTCTHTYITKFSIPRMDVSTLAHAPCARTSITHSHTKHMHIDTQNTCSSTHKTHAHQHTKRMLINTQNRHVYTHTQTHCANSCARGGGCTNLEFIKKPPAGFHITRLPCLRKVRAAEG